MRRWAIILIAGMMLFLQSTSYAEKMQLTQEEAQWLKEHKTLTFGVDPNYPPYEFYDKNKAFSGIDAEIIKLIEKELDITIHPIPDEDWSKTVSRVKTKDLDFISASISEERKKNMLFTDEYVTIPSVIVTARDQKAISSMKDLSGKRVATVKGWLWNDILSKNQPGAKLVVYPTIEAALAAVSFGEVEATVQDTATISYLINLHKFTNLKMAAPYTAYSLNLHFAVRSDYPELQRILEKAVRNIPKEKMEAINRRWISLSSGPYIQWEQIMKVLMGSALLFFAVLIWSLSLHFEVKKRTKALENANKELETSMDRLQEVQRQMIDQEKLAALGSMVAGIAHEVNTPLGVSVTAVSLMKKNLKTMLGLLEGHELKKSDLRAFVSDTEESVQILDQNIERAIALIRGFKTMAVDQMGEERSVFEFCEYLDKIRTNLKYECKKKGIEVVLQCQGPLVVDSYPGVFSHIFTNFIMNSIVHGFEGKMGGRIEIGARVDSEHLILEYRDNGRGMTEETLASMYKPFFTTQKHQGNTGLGMHIVHSLVKEPLGATILCTSAVDQGTQFVIDIPSESWKPKGAE